jgi:uncharacterized membrane protein YagU involved in acid resistance
MSTDARFGRRNIMMPSEQRTSPVPDVLGVAGAIAGIGGGLAMALVGLLIAVALGQDPWLTPKQIAAALGGPTTFQAGFELRPVVLGTALHLVVSALLGVLFEVAIRRVFKLPSNFGIPIVTGLIYGLAIWLLAYFVFLPLMNPVLLNVYAPSFIIQNITYGVTLGMLYSYLRP